MSELYDIPMSDWATYNTTRELNPDAILPLPGEPVVQGRLHGSLRVWASDGSQHGWYDMSGDLFSPGN